MYTCTELKLIKRIYIAHDMHFMQCVMHIITSIMLDCHKLMWSTLVHYRLKSNVARPNTVTFSSITFQS